MPNWLQQEGRTLFLQLLIHTKPPTAPNWAFGLLLILWSLIEWEYYYRQVEIFGRAVDRTKNPSHTPKKNGQKGLKRPRISPLDMRHEQLQTHNDMSRQNIEDAFEIPPRRRTKAQME